MRLRIAATRVLCVLHIALVVSLGPAQRAAAWGFEGHRIVAEIAEQYLSPKAANEVHKLLAIENNSSLADISTWADEIRPQCPETAPSHCVDIPIHVPVGTPPAYDAARDCPRGDCVVAKIEQFATQLADTSPPPGRPL